MKFPLTFGLQMTNLPLIVTSGLLKNFCFLLDTGATHNVIFSFVYEHCKSKFRVLEGQQKIMGIEGQNKECLIVETTFIFEGKEYTPIFLVLDATEAISQVQKETEVQIHGILGTPFFIENKWIIDFDKLTLRTIDTE